MTTKEISAKLLSLPIENQKIDLEGIIDTSFRVNKERLVITFFKKEKTVFTENIHYNINGFSSEEKAHLETFLLLAKNGSIEPSIINAGNGQIKWLVLKNTN